MIYWISTLLISIFLLWSAYTYFFQQSVIEGVRALGFPDFFRIQLAVLKIIGTLALLVPGLPIKIKEWAYAGIGLFLLTALVAHLVHKDSIWISMLLIFFFGLLIISNLHMPSAVV